VSGNEVVHRIKCEFTAPHRFRAAILVRASTMQGRIAKKLAGVASR
jgi:hypothetical protein